MILLTRLNGSPFVVNADLIERVDVTPDTVVTLVDGRKHVVSESAQDVIDRVVAFRASVLAAADGATRPPEHHGEHAGRLLHIVPATTTTQEG